MTASGCAAGVFVIIRFTASGKCLVDLRIQVFTIGADHKGEVPAYLALASFDAGGRCPLHCGPRIHLGVRHHCPSTHIDHQGPPGCGLHRLSGQDPLLSADIRRIIAARREDLLGLRDVALVLVGFAGGFRRSELIRSASSSSAQPAGRD